MVNFRIKLVVVLACLGLLVDHGLAKKSNVSKSQMKEAEEFSKNADIECIRDMVLDLVDNPLPEQVEAVSNFLKALMDECAKPKNSEL